VATYVGSSVVTGSGRCPCNEWRLWHTSAAPCNQCVCGASRASDATNDVYGRNRCNGRRLCTISCNERRLWQVSIAINVIGYIEHRRRSVTVVARFRAHALRPGATAACSCLCPEL